MLCYKVAYSYCEASTYLYKLDLLDCIYTSTGHGLGSRSAAILVKTVKRVSSARSHAPQFDQQPPVFTDNADGSVPFIVHALVSGPGGREGHGRAFVGKLNETV